MHKNGKATPENNPIQKHLIEEVNQKADDLKTGEDLLKELVEELTSFQPTIPEEGDPTQPARYMIFAYDVDRANRLTRFAGGMSDFISLANSQDQGREVIFNLFYHPEVLYPDMDPLSETFEPNYVNEAQILDLVSGTVHFFQKMPPNIQIQIGAAQSKEELFPYKSLSAISMPSAIKP